ncbi:uncharacterized protein LOC127474062 [Manacus candei]|uniref:uncharacterized protein LOC127474062 n=1 Tax=Manacus candei TaxID=415023 RepID=UPI0022264E1A|nr:uncharacterized protein LOC127474062 [Manacus candei]
MNCLPGNGTAGTPGAAWADGLDAPAPPFLPSHWGRVQWWHCQPCRDHPREVKKEGRREVRQQPSSTNCLCKQCPSVPAWLFVALQAEEPRAEMAECWCDPEWVSLPSGQSPELPLASSAEGWELPRASSIQLEDPRGCSSVFLGACPGDGIPVLQSRWVVVLPKGAFVPSAQVLVPLELLGEA